MLEYEFVFKCIFSDDFEIKHSKSFICIFDYIHDVEWLFSLTTGKYVGVIKDLDLWGSLTGGEDCYISGGTELVTTMYYVLFKGDQQLPIQLTQKPMWRSNSRTKLWGIVENDDVGRAEVEIDMDGKVTYLDEYNGD